MSGKQHGVTVSNILLYPGDEAVSCNVRAYLVVRYGRAVGRPKRVGERVGDDEFALLIDQAEHQAIQLRPAFVSNGITSRRIGEQFEIRVLEQRKAGTLLACQLVHAIIIKVYVSQSKLRCYLPLGLCRPGPMN